MAKQEDYSPVSVGSFSTENGFKVIDLGWRKGTGMPYELVFIYTDKGGKYLLKGMYPDIDKVILISFKDIRFVYNTTMWMNSKCRCSSWGSNCPIYFFEKELTGHKKIEIMIYAKGKRTPTLIQVRRVPKRWLKEYDVATTKEPSF